MAYLSYEPRTAKIIRLRKQRLLTQGALADKAGVNPATVSRIERGHKAGPATITKLADALGVEAEDLVA